MLIAAPLWFNATFALLGKRFEYPDILRRPTSEVLERFRVGDPILTRAEDDPDGPVVESVVEAVFVRPEVTDVATLVQRTRRLRAGVAEREFTLTRDGAAVTLVAMATALRGPEGEYAGAVVVFDDLTELLKAQRLAAWREVARRLAHEIKNPLASIRSAVEQLSHSAHSTPDERVLSSLIVRESDRLARLLTEFLDFARVRVNRIQKVDIARLARGAATLAAAHPSRAEGVRVTISTPEENDLFLAAARSFPAG